MVMLGSCEKTCPECPLCETEAALLTEWGEHVKAELVSPFLDIEDLALCQVWNTDQRIR